MPTIADAAVIAPPSTRFNAANASPRVPDQTVKQEKQTEERRDLPEREQINLRGQHHEIDDDEHVRRREAREAERAPEEQRKMRPPVRRVEQPRAA